MEPDNEAENIAHAQVHHEEEVEDEEGAVGGQDEDEDEEDDEDDEEGEDDEQEEEEGDGDAVDNLVASGHIKIKVKLKRVTVMFQAGNRTHFADQAGRKFHSLLL